MDNHTDLEKLFTAHGFVDFKWITPGDMVVAQWVRMKCTYGCPNFGKNATCPPNVPSVPDCRSFFDEYSEVAIFHFEKKLDNPEDRHAWSKEVNRNLLKLEKEGVQGYGIPSGTGIKVFPDGRVAALGGAVPQYVHRADKIQKAGDIQPV